MDDRFKVLQQPPVDPRPKFREHLKVCSIKRLDWDIKSCLRSFRMHINKTKDEEDDDMYAAVPEKTRTQIQETPNSPDQPFFNYTDKRRKFQDDPYRTPLLLQMTWKEYNAFNVFLSDGDDKTKKVEGRKRKLLVNKSTDLENYLMRVHELFRISVDESPVQDECSKLLKNMVRKVSLPYEDVSERRL